VINENPNEKDKSNHIDRHEERLFQRNHLPDILGGITFITIGGILLLNNFQYIPWSVWNYIVNFWPVVFVFIGLDLLSGNSWLLKIVTTIVGLVIIVFVFSYSLSAVDANFRNMMFEKIPAWKYFYQRMMEDKMNRGMYYNGNPNYYWDGTNYYRN